MNACRCGRAAEIAKTGECRRCYQRRYHRTRRRRAPHERATQSERFWAKVEPSPTNECWLWRAGRSGRYGSFDHMLAHRFAWEEQHGPIPEGLTLDHECETSTCVNPDHLNPVPARVNTLLGHERRGAGRYQTHCIRGHELTPANTVERQRPDGIRRDCVVCIRMRRAAESERTTCPDCHEVRARSSMRRHRRLHERA